MKFKIEKTVLLAALNKFLTKGRLKLKSKEDYLIKSAKIIALGDFVTFIGRDIGSVIYCRSILKSDVTEDGEAFISDILVLHETVKNMKGKDITIAIDSGMSVSDGKQTFTFGIQAIEGFTDLPDWDKANIYDNDTVRYEDKNGNYTYDYWFGVEDSSEMNDLSRIIYKQIITGNVTLETTDKGLSVKCENTQLNRKYEDIYKVDVGDKKSMLVGHVFPVLDSIDGVTDFYYHILTSGKLRMWIVNGNTQWMVKYNEFKESGEEVKEEEPDHEVGA